jgi:hypothetical protein
MRAAMMYWQLDAERFGDGRFEQIIEFLFTHDMTSSFAPNACCLVTLLMQKRAVRDEVAKT